jgi:SAM-dependent methyltransferase
MLMLRATAYNFHASRCFCSARYIEKRGTKSKYKRRKRQQQRKAAAAHLRSKVVELDSLNSDFRGSSAVAWESFYEKNNSYQDRWLGQWDIPELATAGAAIEIGCGVGNSAIPMLKQFPELFLYATDLSLHAVQTTSSRAAAEGLGGRLHAFAADAVQDNLQPQMQDPKHVDLACLVFMLSAIRTSDVPALLANIRGVLTPNSILYIRDYALGDFRQSRFSSERKLGVDDVFARSDGTICRFLTLDALDSEVCTAGFELLGSRYVKRHLKGHEFARQRVKANPAAYCPDSKPNDDPAQRVFIEAKYRLVA